MPQRDERTAGAPCWIDLFSSDTTSSRAFYGDLFGWTSEESGPEYGGYINFLREGAPVAGCMANDGQSGMPDLWTVYLVTGDAETLAAAVPGHGGQVIVAPMPVMDLGSMAVLSDPGQASIGAWQPGAHRGFSVIGEPGAPRWFELHTGAYDASVAFYRELFGWDTQVVSDAADFRYTTLGEGDDARAGIMDASGFLGDAPASWSVYFGVEDADRCLATIVELGGTVLEPAADTPYGRLAAAADPTGARFKIMAT